MPTVARSKLTAAQRCRNASIAALNAGLGRTRRERARGQAGLRVRFEREARAEDPGASEAEIARRAQVRYRLHFKRMAADRGNPRVLCARCAHPITSPEINRAGKRTHCYRISRHGRCPCQEFTPPKGTTT